jgi:hypothetical protein
MIKTSRDIKDSDLVYLFDRLEIFGLINLEVQSGLQHPRSF